MKILLAVDGSQCSVTATEEVARRPWPDGSRIKILSVYEPVPLLAVAEAWAPPQGYYEGMERHGRERAEVAVAAAAARLQEIGLPVETEVAAGLPKEEIVAVAERWEADLIVMGSHGYRGWTRLWLGSVSHAVATHASCSVEIVRRCKPSDAPPKESAPQKA